MSIASRLKAASRPNVLWKGPEDDSPLGGITQSMMSDFLSCKERFRVKYVEGLQPISKFNRAIEFGNMWHECEEALASQGVERELVRVTGLHKAARSWESALRTYSEKLSTRYPFDRGEILKWTHVIQVQFPEYIRYWSAHPDVLKREPILQEKLFKVRYDLPSGRTVILRGKWDSVDLIGDGIWLKENKTKTKFDLPQIQRQLSFDLQTATYLTALYQDTGIDELEEVKMRVGKGKTPAARAQWAIKGTSYNVVRRECPIKQHEGRQLKSGWKEGESVSGWMERLRSGYFAAKPDEWFARFSSKVSHADILLFQRTFLNPFLENMCWWYDEVTGGRSDYPPPPTHWRTPFGIYSALTESGFTEMDEYLANGSTVGLRRIETLFPELELKEKTCS